MRNQPVGSVKINSLDDEDHTGPLRVNPRYKNLELWRIAVLLLSAAALDLYHLTAKSLWMDEGFSVFMAQTDLRSFWHMARSGEVNMVLYYLALRIWMHLGQHEFWLRLLSVLPAIATVPVVYAIGKRFFGVFPAFAAAFLFALHPSEVMYAQEIRSYSVAVLLVALSCLFFLRLLEEGRKRKLDWLGYVVSSALAPFAHVFAILVLISQWTWLAIFCPGQLSRREMKGVLAALCLLQLPLAWMVLTSYQGAVNWVPSISSDRILAVWSFLSLPKWRGMLYVAAWIAAIIGTCRTKEKMQRSHASFLVFWLVLPFLLTLLISLRKPILVERFLLVCVPASALLGADGIRRLPKSAGVLGFLVIGFVSYNSVLSYYRHLHTQEDWRGAAAYVLPQLQAGDEVIIAPAYCRFTFDYYHRESPFAVMPIVYGDWEADTRWSPRSKRIWLLVRDLPVNPEMDALLKRLTTNAYIPYEVREARRFNLIRVLLVTSR